MSDTSTLPTAASTTRHTPGTFCWWEIATTDLEAAKTFYQGLFGWTFSTEPLEDGRAYVMIFHDGKPLGALYALMDQQVEQGIPPHWLSYIATNDIDATVALVKQQGGTLLMGPMDIADAGRMAVIQDPQGAAFASWEGKQHAGASAMGESSTVCWNELATTDREAATSFYQDLYGYSKMVQNFTGTPYTSLMVGEKPEAGLLQMDEAWEGIPPNWLPYLGVDDINAATTRVKELGGKTLHEAVDIPAVGIFSVVQDPQGATFAIIQFHPPA